jgi:hypothetical protein
MARRQPIAQVEVKTINPNYNLIELKKKGWHGYIMTKSQHLWLHGTVADVKKALPKAKIIKAIGQPE